MSTGQEIKKPKTSAASPGAEPAFQLIDLPPSVQDQIAAVRLDGNRRAMRQPDLLNALDMPCQQRPH